MKIDKKYYPMLALAGGLILLLIILVLVMILLKGGNQSYAFIEAKIISAAQNYYANKNEELPKNLGEQSTVDLATLVSGGFMNDVSSYRKGASCQGKVVVTKFAGGYSYNPNINCGEDYKTVLLVDKLLDDVVTSGDGLYKFDAVAKVSPGISLNLDNDGYDLSTNPSLGGYIYRGLQPNNYVSIDKNIYRIVKIDKNNDMHIILNTQLNEYKAFDNRYNSDVESKVGFNDFATSLIRRDLNNKYNNFEKDSIIKTRTVPKNICIGGRLPDDIGTDGKIECSKVVKNQYIAFLPAFDVMNASLSSNCNKISSKECINDNFIITDASTYTVTPNLENSSTVYIYGDYTGFEAKEANQGKNIFYTLFLSNTARYEAGDGSLANPYIIK